MMKNRTIQGLLKRIAVLAGVFVCLSSQALAYNAQIAGDWMTQFAQALMALDPVYDPVLTADPARAGEYLLEYEFGTVSSRTYVNPQADDILEIDVRTDQVTDCRGVRVGMHVEQALGSASPVYGDSPLYVISVRESDPGWSWAYVGEGGVYGVEYIAYGEYGAAMKEYTLTYIIENDVISAIRMKLADATIAQAQEGLKTAFEIADRQDAGILIAANNQMLLKMTDLTVMGSGALGVAVDHLIAGMGEPNDIQTLPQGAGRMLIYDGAVVTLGFNEMTGEEVVRAVSVSNPAYEGPNRLKVGMSVHEAGSLFRCDADIYRRGGLLYLEGEALGEAPYGELKVADANEMTLTYACAAAQDIGLLQAIVVDDVVVSWQLMYMSDMQGGI